MGATLTIKRLEEMARRWYGQEIADARTERDRFQRKMRRWLGKEEANRIIQFVQAAADPSISSPLPYLCPLADKAFVTLVSLELALQEIESRVESLSSFSDPYTVGALLPTLGLSWWVDIRPMIEPSGHQGHMPIENVRKFLGMVTDARQVFPTQKQIEERRGIVDRNNDLEHWHDYFRRQRRRLISFLERAVRIGEPICCSL